MHLCRQHIDREQQGQQSSRSKILTGMPVPIVLAVQFANSQDDGDDDEGDNSEAPGGGKHEDQDHACLSYTPQSNVQVQAHLV